MCPDFRQDLAVVSIPLWFIFDIYLIPSLHPPRIDRASIPYDSILLSPDPFTMSITDQITDSLSCLTYAHPQQAYPSPSRENAIIPRSSLIARALPSHGVSPVLFPSRGDYSSVFPAAFYASFCASLSQWHCNLHSHGSGSTVQFQNPNGWETSSVRTDYQQQLSHILWSHFCQRLAVLLVMLSLWGRVKRPVALIV
jgi:hypothetical protein